MTDLKALMTEAAEKVEETLDKLLPTGEGREARVFEAMRYSSLDGGKRLRPFLVLHAANLFGVSEASSLRAGAAVEMIHCYSLVHDDLPAMDDDDMRRGRPTCHKKFDEATAILAGDGLLTMAFEVLSHEDTHGDPAVRANLCLALARAAGAHGMVGGQMFDLAAENEQLGIGEITHLQRLKTGALIDVSCQMGAILGRASEPARQALHHYAHDIGLAFQIQDDLLDHESTAEELGKATQKDAAAGKATFVSILGLEQAKAQAAALVHQAIAHLSYFDDRGTVLANVARFIVDRRN